MKNLFIFTQQKSNGVSVILDNLKKYLEVCDFEVFIVSEISSLHKDSFIIPYGIKESDLVLQKGYNCNICFLVDSISLGYLNKIKFYLRIRYLNNFDFFYSLYGFLKYSKKEIRVANSYKNVMLVSEIDKKYLISKNVQSNIFVLPNGYNLLSKSQKDYNIIVRKKKLTFGILSNWGTKQTFHESFWFVNKIWNQFSKDYNVELVIAGRGELINHFEGQSIRSLGEIENLDEFFSQIDVFISANPKGCGILNRLLDAFSYNCLVFAHPNSLSGFSTLLNGNYSFTNLKQFENSYLDLINNPEKANIMVNNSRNYIKKFHNWERNYLSFIRNYFNMNKN